MTGNFASPIHPRNFYANEDPAYHDFPPHFNPNFMPTAPKKRKPARIKTPRETARLAAAANVPPPWAVALQSSVDRIQASLHSMHTFLERMQVPIDPMPRSMPEIDPYLGGIEQIHLPETAWGQARTDNIWAMLTGLNLPFTPLELPPAPGKQAMRPPPTNFPATARDVFHMSIAAITELLANYGLPLDGPVEQGRTRFLIFIGAGEQRPITWA